MTRSEPAPRNFLLVALGSHGDVHPFIGIGLGLRARGHRVRVIANPWFQPLIENAGLETLPVGTAEEYRQIAMNPDCWKRVGGTRTVLAAVSGLIRPMYETIAEQFEPGRTVLAASSLALGARVAEEHLHIPAATIHLQPAILRSLIDPPTLQAMFLSRRTPMWMRRLQFGMVDWMVDRLLGPSLNGFRRELGLKPVSGILRSYVHSPRRVIGLFPDWFAPPAPDWPEPTRLTGFPLYDEAGLTAMPAELEEFLAAGEPPIAFTPGSAMWNGRRFFEESAAACARLGRRGVLLSRHRDHLPAALPPGVRHFDYAPFSELLPRCAALVHHGGIGTSSQALAAATPQLVVPHAHDQFDNAARLARLGVARVLDARRYRAARIERNLRALIQSEEVHRRCREWSGRFGESDPIAETCNLLEELPSIEVTDASVFRSHGAISFPS